MKDTPSTTPTKLESLFTQAPLLLLAVSPWMSVPPWMWLPVLVSGFTHMCLDKGSLSLA